MSTNEVKSFRLFFKRVSNFHQVIKLIFSYSIQSLYYCQQKLILIRLQKICIGSFWFWQSQNGPCIADKSDSNLYVKFYSIGLDSKPLTAYLKPLIELNYLSSSSVNGQAKAEARSRSGEFKEIEPSLLKVSISATVAFLASVTV